MVLLSSRVKSADLSFQRLPDGRLLVPYYPLARQAEQAGGDCKIKLVLQTKHEQTWSVRYPKSVDTT
jgi:hypothetical protein